jgi:4-cresol dehydrogenase (hydroxylating) flavoprotein subunit
MACQVDVPRESDLEPLVDRLTQLLLRGVIQNHPVIGNIIRHISTKGGRSQFYDGEGAIPDGRLESIRKELDIGFWDAKFALYGDEELLDLNYRKIQKSFADIPGVKLVGRKYLPKAGEEYIDPEAIPMADGGVQVGVPTLVPLLCLNYRGEDSGHIGFSPILPPSGKDALDFYYTAKKRSAEYGFDFRAGLHLYDRHLAHINLLLYDRRSEKQRTNVHKLFVALVKDAREAGYSEYRAHVKHQELVAGMYDWPEGKAHGRLFSEKLKDALDPNGIFSEGKNGIWSQNRRAQNKDVIPGETSNGVNGANGVNRHA